MQADALADQFRLQDIALKELTGEEDGGYGEDPGEIRPELYECHANRHHQSDERTDIGDERDHAGDEADQQAEIQPDERQADCVVNAEDEAERALATDEAGNGLIHVAGDLADDLHLIPRDPAIDLAHHAIPVEQDVEGDDRGDDQQRHDVDDRLAGIPDLRQ
ncbi:hypothetical protein D3C73_1008040 [compost metagenome]